MIFCGQAIGGSPDAEGAILCPLPRNYLAPLLGGTDVDLITGADTSPHITQSETFVFG